MLLCECTGAVRGHSIYLLGSCLISRRTEPDQTSILDKIGVPLSVHLFHLDQSRSTSWFFLHAELLSKVSPITLSFPSASISRPLFSCMLTSICKAPLHTPHVFVARIFRHLKLHRYKHESLMLRSRPLVAVSWPRLSLSLEPLCQACVVHESLVAIRSTSDGSSCRAPDGKLVGRANGANLESQPKAPETPNEVAPWATAGGCSPDHRPLPFWTHSVD